MSTVEVSLKEGPLLIPSLAGLGIKKTYPLENRMSASEFFPPHVESAFYVLSLRKSVHNPGEVSKVEAELVSALRLLATAWPFSGGSFMVLDTRDVVISSRFESNADRVHSELLAAGRKTLIASSVTSVVEALATYEQPPLKVASIVAKTAMRNHGLRKLLAYHQIAWVEYYGHRQTDRSAWFIDLYKVRDFLKKLYGGERAARSNLSITYADWSFFGHILNNNDLRHAEVTGVVPPVASLDVDRLYRLAKTWIQIHLKSLGLPVP